MDNSIEVTLSLNKDKMDSVFGIVNTSDGNLVINIRLSKNSIDKILKGDTVPLELIMTEKDLLIMR